MKYLSLALLALVGLASVAQADHRGVGGSAGLTLRDIWQQIENLSPEERAELRNKMLKGARTRGIFGGRIDRSGTGSKFGGWSQTPARAARGGYSGTGYDY